MKVDFKKEVLATQARFNRTFGRQRISDLETRQQVILSIIYMRLLYRQISASGMTDETRVRIRQLSRVKDTLNAIFDNFEVNYRERRKFDHESRDTPKGISKSKRSWEHNQNMPAVHKSVRAGLVQGRL